MREQVLARIYEIREKEQGFPKGRMRWESFNITEKHISEVKFEELEDSELAFHFERIIRRFYTQM